MSGALYIEGTEIRCVDHQTGGRTSEYLYELKRSHITIHVRVIRRRRKSIALYLEKGTLPELRVPTNCAWNDIHSFLGSKFDWIIATQSELASRTTAPRNIYTHGGEVSYLGRRVPLVLAKSRFNVVEADDTSIYVSCANPSSPQAVEKQIIHWYRRQAEALFPERTQVIGGLFPVRCDPTRVTVRKMKARYGSCSSTGEICFNLLLMKAGVGQIDFVVAHELCHLRYFSHNAGFYALLGEIMPDWKEQEAILHQVV
ncbi:M48 family metallopeptidase [Gammaproteobacteria bacterium]|nr:M48 family metallopeptidase [Gammaproteobacteria bacterium]